MLQIRTCFCKCISRNINSLSNNKRYTMNLSTTQRKKIKKPCLDFNAKLKVCKTLMGKMNER